MLCKVRRSDFKYSCPWNYLIVVHSQLFLGNQYLLYTDIFWCCYLNTYTAEDVQIMTFYLLVKTCKIGLFHYGLFKISINNFIIFHVPCKVLDAFIIWYSNILLDSPSACPPATYMISSGLLCATNSLSDPYLIDPDVMPSGSSLMMLDFYNFNVEDFSKSCSCRRMFN